MPYFSSLLVSSDVSKRERRKPYRELQGYEALRRIPICWKINGLIHARWRRWCPREVDLWRTWIYVSALRGLCQWWQVLGDDTNNKVLQCAYSIQRPIEIRIGIPRNITDTFLILIIGSARVGQAILSRSTSSRWRGVLQCRPQIPSHGNNPTVHSPMVLLGWNVSYDRIRRIVEQDD